MPLAPEAKKEGCPWQGERKLANETPSGLSGTQVQNLRSVVIRKTQHDKKYFKK